MELTSETSRQKLLSKCFTQIEYDEKYLHRKDFTRVGIIKDDGEIEPIREWSACRYCFQGFRTHKEGKNVGTSHLQRHKMICNSASKPSSSGLKQRTLSNFAYVKHGLNSSQKNKLKMAELKFVVMGQHSFNTVENDGLLELAQTCVDIGSESGKIDIKTSWFGRKTIRDLTFQEHSKVIDEIKKQIKWSIENKCISCTTDLWTDDHVKRSYLDFTLFWITEDFSFKRCIVKCKEFSHEHKTSKNIQSEITSIFEEFSLKSADTPITTDAGANIVSALSDETGFQCMAHRLNTVLSDAWNKTKDEDCDLKLFYSSVLELKAFVMRSSGISEKLPKKLKGESGTRPWRGYCAIFDSLSVSYDTLIQILIERNEEDRIKNVSKELCEKLARFFDKFNAVFDKLESSSTPSMQYVIPVYYIIVDKLCSPCSTDPQCIIKLKENIFALMGRKYWSSTTEMHKLGTFLDPSFKELKFLPSNTKKNEL